MKNNKLILALATFLIASSFISCSSDSSSGDSSSEQKIVYVDNSNTSGFEDGSYEHPYSTIQKAIDSSSENNKDNTLVYIRKGNKPYSVEEGSLVDLDGTKNLTLWGSGYNEGFPGIPATGYPVLQSSNLKNERPIYLKDVENITIIGLDLRGGEQNVVYAGGARKLTIKHCIVSGAEPAPVWNKTSGILIYSFGGGDKSSDIAITDNTFYDNHTGGINVSVFGDAEYGFEGLNTSSSFANDVDKLPKTSSVEI